MTSKPKSDMPDPVKETPTPADTLELEKAAKAAAAAAVDEQAKREPTVQERVQACQEQLSQVLQAYGCELVSVIHDLKPVGDTRSQGLIESSVSIRPLSR